MNQRTRLIVLVAAVVLAVGILAVGLAGRGAPPGPTNDTEQLVTPAATTGPISTAMEGEKAAAVAGQGYNAYRPREALCDELVEDGRSESCVWPKHVELITRPEWEQLLPDTDFYLVGLAGRHQDTMYDHSYRLELAAWHEDKGYVAETHDRLLAANGITGYADDNRELVAEAFALMTIPGYLGEEIVFTEWEDIKGQPGQYKHDYNHCLRGWTELQGLEVGWCFVFVKGYLKIATGPMGIQQGIGDYVEVHFEQLSLPGQKDYRFAGG